MVKGKNLAAGNKRINKNFDVKISLALVCLISLILILSVNFISAAYARSFPAYTNQPTLTFTGGQPFQLFNKQMCQAGQDFILQVSPLGCEPSVIRSDLLEEQNVPVFCPIVATQLNPLIDVQAIDYVTITGQTPKEVSGLGYQPAQAALGNVGRNINLNSPTVLDNIGYAVIVLRQQPNETAMPDFVQGNLTAKLRYNIRNAFGVGKADFYLPVLTDKEWQQTQVRYSFWQGRGYLRAESVDDNSAVISIYSDREASATGTTGNKARIASENLDVGKTSGQIPMPGFNFCFGTMQLKLNGLESPDTTVQLEINGDSFELKQGDKFLDDKCQVRSIDEKGINEKATITCREDTGSSTFELGVKPKIKLSVKEVPGEYSAGDRLYDKDSEKSVYLVYIGTEDNSKNEDSLLVVVAAVPGHTQKLDAETLNSIAGFIERRPSSERKTIGSLTIDAAKFAISGTEKILRGIISGQDFENIGFGETKKAFGNKISLIGFAEAHDKDISTLADEGLKSNYNNAIKDYGIVTESFSTDTYPDGNSKTLGEEALYNEIEFQWAMSQTKTVKELCKTFEENYPSAFIPGMCSDAAKLASSENAVRDTTILGRTYRIAFNDISEPSLEDFGATIHVNGPGLNKDFDLRKNQVVYLNETTGETIQLLDLNKDSAKFSVNLKTGAVETVKQFALDTKNLKLNIPDDFGSKYTFTLSDVNLKKSAHVSIIPNVNFAETNATFNFKIGIEKRGIQLTPEQTQDKIQSLNETIKKWEDINSNLGKVVSADKAACLAIGTVLTVKNFFSNLGGEGIARQKVMRSSGGWFDICKDAVNRGEYSDVDSCLLKNNDKIENAVNSYSDEIKKQNNQFDSLQKGITKNSLLGEDVVDTDKLADKYITDSYKSEVSLSLQTAGITQITSGNENILVSSIVGNMTSKNIPITQARSIQLNSRLLNSDDETIRQLARAQLKADLADFWINSRQEVQRQSFAQQAGSAAASIISTKDLREVPIISKDTWSNVKNKYNLPLGDSITDSSYVYFLKDSSDNKKYLLVLDNDYVIQKTYEIGGNNALSLSDKQPNPLGLDLKFYDSNTYKNKYQNPEIRYYEQGQYKGLPSIVPFDTENGWYAAVKSVLPFGGSIKAYDTSGRVSSFWLCNVGGNGREEFDLGSVDDICQEFNLGTGQPYNQFPGLEPNEASRKVNQAVSAIEQASRAHRTGVSSVNINDKNIAVGKPSLNIPDIQCQDFMSAADCNLLFNVCDPVVCPSSRCDFGGSYPVEDVLQSGVIGGLLLCLPNFPEVKVPVCLSAIHAGSEAYLSVLQSYQQCLQTSLDTGQTVGVCDELHSVYMCEFFWRQGLPLAQALVPQVAGKIAGQAVRGGGEYLGVQDAFKKASDSVNYFTQSYATNSYKAFKARSAEGVGTQICQNWVSYTSPEGGGLLDALTAPDSPNQFYGQFDEIPFTTATNPPVSQYKVFYHVYAGKDFPAYYQVYLRGSGSSFFQDTSLGRLVAQGFVAAGEFKTDTVDFTAPSGYQQMCIIVNGREECGFKQVTTDFGINYMTEQYVASQAHQTNIRSESECVSGTVNIYSLLNPNLQSGVEEGLVNPAIYNRGITRVCATDNPGLGSDPNINTESSRWQKVGICGSPNTGCWLDTQSVKNVIKDTNLENQTLKDVSQNYIDVLNQETGAVDFEQLRKSVEEEKDNTAKINLINDNINKIFFNNQKGYLTLLRADAYAGLARSVYEKIRPSILETTQTKTTEGSYPVLEYEDGSPDVNIFYTYSGASWFWTLTPNAESSWVNVDNEPDKNVVKRDADITFIKSLRNQNYISGLQLLMQRTTSSTALSTDNVKFTSDKILSYNIGDVTQQDIELDQTRAYFRFNEALPGNWEWSTDRKGKDKWTSVNDAIPSDVQDEVAVLIDSLTGKNYLAGVQTLFAIDAQTFPGIKRATLTDEQVSCGDCGKGLFNFCGEIECRTLSQKSGVQCSFENGFFINTCKQVQNTAISLTCTNQVSCQKALGQEVIKIAKEEKQKLGSNSNIDNYVKSDTGLKTFECLVLAVANVESGIRQCINFQENGNPLYCDGNRQEVLGGDEDLSLGVMQINSKAHGEKLFFEDNVRTGVNLLIQGQASTPREYVCNSKTYRGWQRALRQYNGWPVTDNIDCTKGNVNYVETVLSTSNINAVKNLFPNVC